MTDTQVASTSRDVAYDLFKGQVDKDAVLKQMKKLVKGFVANDDFAGLWVWLEPAMVQYSHVVAAQVRLSEMNSAARKNAGVTLTVTNRQTGKTTVHHHPEIMDVRDTVIYINGRRVRFGDMTIADHEEKIADLNLQMDGMARTLERHAVTIDLLRQAGKSTLDECDDSVVAVLQETE
tara:strand:- start:16 stop:549 length:534 start_codon:yes stop_codon:yes gene_type:complete